MGYSHIMVMLLCWMGTMFFILDATLFMTISWIIASMIAFNKDKPLDYFKERNEVTENGD